MLRLHDKNHCEVRDPCHYTCKYRSVARDVRNLKYNVLKETPVAFLKNIKLRLSFYHKIIDKQV